jgi:hypothetical protein
MKLTLRWFIVALCFAAVMHAAMGQAKKKGPAKPATEDDYYKLLRFDVPRGEVLEAGAIEILPDGKVAVGTRRGEIWLIHNAYAKDPKKAKFTRFAHGLHEVLGLGQKAGWLYVTQRPELSRIKHANGSPKKGSNRLNSRGRTPSSDPFSGKANLFETVSDGWEVSGDYHEYALGSRCDKEGNVWITLCLTGSFTSDCKFRGWAVKVTPEGKMIPIMSGVRSPGGVGFNAEGDVFYTDNQGPWNGACNLKQVVVGGFAGHPESFKWYKEKEARYLGPAPKVPKSGSRIMTEAKKIPQLVPPAVIFPYGKMGQSASGIDCDLSGGKFGPFAKQLFVGDQTHSTVMRVFLEKVDGRYQGVCFPFRQGFGSGCVPVRFGKDGSLFVGGTNRGWGSRGNKSFAIERLVWTGKVPFEIHEMRARKDGFELTFTQPVDPATAGKVSSYQMKTFTYIYQASYGSPEVDQTTPKITKAAVGKDHKSVRLWVNGLQIGHVHDLALAGVRSAEGQPLLHPQAYYTLNYIPAR